MWGDYARCIDGPTFFAASGTYTINNTNDSTAMVRVVQLPRLNVGAPPHHPPGCGWLTERSTFSSSPPLLLCTRLTLTGEKL